MNERLEQANGDYQVIALSPWSVQEMYDLMIKAFNLSERHRVPVYLMGDEAVGHLRERMDVPAEVEVFNRVKKPGVAPFGTDDDDGVPPMPAFGDGEKLLVTGSTHDAWGVRKTDDPLAHSKLVTRINKKILNHREKIIETESYWAEDAKIMLVAYGFTARSAYFAADRLRKAGERVGLLRLKTLWPFPDRAVAEVGRGARKILVPEMNQGQVAGEVMRYAKCDVASYAQTNGEIIHPDRLIKEIRSLLS